MGHPVLFKIQSMKKIVTNALLAAVIAMGATSALAQLTVTPVPAGAANDLAPSGLVVSGAPGLSVKQVPTPSNPVITRTGGTRSDTRAYAEGMTWASIAVAVIVSAGAVAATLASRRASASVTAPTGVPGPAPAKSALKRARDVRRSKKLARIAERSVSGLSPVPPGASTPTGR